MTILRSGGSIRRRLTLQLVGSVALLTAILFFLVQSFARQLAEESQDSILLASAFSILDSITVQDGAINADIPYAALSMLGNVSEDRVFYRVSIGSNILTGYADLPQSNVVGNDPDFFTAPYRNDSIRLVTVSRHLALNGNLTEVSTTVAQTQGGLTAKLASISRTALYLGTGFFIIAALLAIWAAQSSLRPLKSLTGAISRRGPQDLRPVTSMVPLEMAPLVSSLNHFMHRLDMSLNRSEDFITEAAHRIRTPLATVRTQAEVALLRVERPENRSALKEMIRAIDESSRAAGQLLDHAMVAYRTDHLVTEEFDLSSLIAVAVERIQPIASLKDIQLMTSLGERTPISGDPILVQNAIINILDNAIKYSEPETRIDISVKKANKITEVSIIDQGPGFPSESNLDLTERFARGSNVGSTVGSGLGLTIANDVALAHGGTMKRSNKAEGSGACVLLSFPS